MFPHTVLTLAAAVIDRARDRGLKVATAESCTGGLVAAALTDVAGSSAVFDRGFVTYSNAAKIGLLGVLPDVLEAHGAVSPEVALAMAEGTLERSDAAVAVSVTGIAGPGGGSVSKPVGLVHFAAVGSGGAVQVERRFGDIGREAVRLASVHQALELIQDRLA